MAIIKNYDGFDIGEEIARRGKLLSREENIELVKRIQQGDKEAETQFIFDNGNFVKSIIREKYPNYIKNDDILQQGLIGLIEGAKRYDESFGTAVSTHCFHWIRQKIQRYITDNEQTIRIPVHMYDRLQKVRKLRDRYYVEKASNEIGNIDLESYILENMPELGDTNANGQTKLEEIFLYIDGTTSLNKPIGEEEHGEIPELGDYIADEKSIEAESIEELYFKEERAIKVNEIIGQVLKDRELEVIKRRMGFYGSPETLDSIAKDYGVTRERIRQIEVKALRKLRNPKYSRILSEYM